MKKKQKNGFVLMETLIVSTLILTTLVFLYLEFKSVKNKYEYSFRYDTVPGIYCAQEMVEYLKTVGYDNISELLNENTYYINITSSSSVNGDSDVYNTLIDDMKIDSIIFTKRRLSGLKNYLNTSSYDKALFDNKFKNYILSLKDEDVDGYKIIIKFNDKTYASYDIKDGETTVAKTYSVGEAIYLDPTNLSTTCDASNSVSTPGTKSGCMKFYVIKDNGSSVDMILDHNTTAKVAYETSGTYKEYAQASIKSQVDSDTQGWSGNPRLITADEIAVITGNDGWSSSTATSSQYFYFGSNNTTDYASQTDEQKARQRSYAWLFDYTNGCTTYGCNIADSSTYGYWTSSPLSGSSSHAWYVYYYGILSNYYYVANGSLYGIRPVITVSKNVIN